MPKIPVFDPPTFCHPPSSNSQLIHTLFLRPLDHSTPNMSDYTAHRPGGALKFKGEDKYILQYSAI